MAVKTIVDEAVRVLLADPKLPKSLLVLEAGCGSTSDVDLPRTKRIVGIDIDAEQLKHNDILDVKIQGDLQTCELTPNEFDIVACVDVLEHIPFPEKAIANMCRGVKQGGYLLIAGPEPYSYKGLVAKYTPHSMRFFIFKLLTGRTAPELRRVHGNGQIFIPTYLRPICSRRNLSIAGKQHGLNVVFEKGVDGYSKSDLLRPAYKPFLGIVRFFTRIIEVLSGGRVNLLLADFVILLKKPEESQANFGGEKHDHVQNPIGAAS